VDVDTYHHLSCMWEQRSRATTTSSCVEVYDNIIILHRLGDEGLNRL
jgi:hypothetical protein